MQQASVGAPGRAGGVALPRPLPGRGGRAARGRRRLPRRRPRWLRTTPRPSPRSASPSCARATAAGAAPRSAVAGARPRPAAGPRLSRPGFQELDHESSTCPGRARDRRRPRRRGDGRPRATRTRSRHYRAGTVGARSPSGMPRRSRSSARRSTSTRCSWPAHYGLGQTMMATKRFTEAVTAFVARARRSSRARLEAASNRDGHCSARLDDQIRALQDDVDSARRQASGTNASQRSRRRSSATRTRSGPCRTSATAAARGRCRRLTGCRSRSAARTSARATSRKPSRSTGRRSSRSPISARPTATSRVLCMMTGRLDEADREIALAEKAGLKVPQGLKDDIQKRRQPQP